MSSETAPANAEAVWPDGKEEVVGIDRRWGIAALAYAALVALSRVYVCAHWPTDVMAGAVLGATMAAIVFYAVRRCGSNRSESTEL